MAAHHSCRPSVRRQSRRGVIDIHGCFSICCCWCSDISCTCLCLVDQNDAGCPTVIQQAEQTAGCDVPHAYGATGCGQPPAQRNCLQGCGDDHQRRATQIGRSVSGMIDNPGGFSGRGWGKEEVSGHDRQDPLGWIRVTRVYHTLRFVGQSIYPPNGMATIIMIMPRMSSIRPVRKGLPPAYWPQR